jgi:CRISPR-associated protein Cmr4
MTTKILYIFTRTPLHVGAGASVGAIDQPVQRERHTGFPIIPASSIKGSFADHWNGNLHDEEPDKEGKVKRVRVTKGGSIAEAAWLFGSDNDKSSFAGSLIFSEARVLAFPIRSAKGSYAWVTCPLMLQRAKRDGVIITDIPSEPKDDEALFKTDGPLALSVSDSRGSTINQVVLEEYTFTNKESYPEALAKELSDLIDDELYQSIAGRLVILSNGMMSHFVSTTCQIAQHVRISDETGTAEEGGLFNQENVPSETLFYSILSATKSRVATGELKYKSADDALGAVETKIQNALYTFQFGGDASTGLGFCSVTINPKKGV